MVFIQDNGSITASAKPSVGFVGWSPDFDHAKEAGDVTWTRDKLNEKGGVGRTRSGYPVPPPPDHAADRRPLTFNELQPRYRPPAPANDNWPAGAGKPRVIGLMGYGGAGKSEVAKYLAGIGYTRTHIKTPLRAMAASLLSSAGYSPDEIDSYLDGDLKREAIPGFRRSGTEIQQFLGTEFGREFCYADLWLDLWRNLAKTILGDGGRLVQESVRFANEAEAIRELGGLVVRVERPGVGPLSDHPSERPPCEPDFTIYNNGSLTDLHLQVATWLRHAA